jgi:hypothetical protein
MRNGILLAEDSPQSILDTYQVDTLENAFLQLCVKHGVSDEANDNLKNVDTYQSTTDASDQQKSQRRRKNSIESNNSNTPCCGTDMDCSKKSILKRLQITTKRRMRALLAKNFLQMLRQPA